MRASSRPRVLCVGETMAMVVPQQRERVRTAQDFLLGTGGAESTVAMYLADYGARVSWFSALGTDALGDRILDAVASPGVDVSMVRRDADHPTGLYVKDPRPDGTTVRYYRAGSAASFLDAVPVGHFNLVHVSGITPRTVRGRSRPSQPTLRPGPGARGTGVLRRQLPAGAMGRRNGAQ
jgi:2-dehydro-3-deoxygluconokinase